jgi:hypothetical protein
VSQLSKLLLPNFHIWIPATVHSTSLDMAMLLVNTLSPGGKASVKEAYVPAPQSVQSMAPVDAEYLPAAQSVHTAEPVAVLNFPAVHNTHVSPSGAVAPALQVQSVIKSDA